MEQSKIIDTLETYHPCKNHSGAKPSTHMLRQCSFTQRLLKGNLLPPPPGAGPQQLPLPPPPPLPGARADNAFPRPDAAYVVFTSEGDDKHAKRKHQAEVNAVVPPVPQYMHWSDRPVSGTREDHPAVMPTPGGYALVLDPTFVSEKRTCRFSRVLIDGGSSINILYRDTMTKLGIEAR
jgi:hypothetical protein